MELRRAGSHRGRRAVLTLALAMALVAVLSVFGQVPAASAGELAGRMVFTANDPFYRLSDRNGTFTAQVSWGAPGMPVAWSFTPGPSYVPSLQVP